MRERGVHAQVVDVDQGQEIPRPSGFDALLAFGGPMNVDEDEEYEWLAAEKRIVGEAVCAGVPYFGVCLGAQLLARSLGAPVYPATKPEVGLLKVRLTGAAQSDPLFSDLPDPLPCFQWHGDTFDLPAGSTLLATSAVCRNQAFRWGSAYGIQFHLEVTPRMVAEWAQVPAYQASLEAVRGPQGMAELRQELIVQGDLLEELCARLFDGFLGVVGRRGASV